jgi:hypothetical protein
MTEIQNQKGHNPASPNLRTFRLILQLEKTECDKSAAGITSDNVSIVECGKRRFSDSCPILGREFRTFSETGFQRAKSHPNGRPGSKK